MSCQRPHCSVRRIVMVYYHVHGLVVFSWVRCQITGVFRSDIVPENIVMMSALIDKAILRDNERNRWECGYGLRVFI